MGRSGYLLVDFLEAVDLRAVDFLRPVDFLRDAELLFALLLDEVFLRAGLVVLLDEELPEPLLLPSELFDEFPPNRR